MRLEVVSPTKKLVDTDVDGVTLPGYLGEMGILPGHAPVLTILAKGTVRYREGGKESDPIEVTGGYAEILGDRVIVLADSYCVHVNFRRISQIGPIPGLQVRFRALPAGKPALLPLPLHRRQYHRRRRLHPGGEFSAVGAWHAVPRGVGDFVRAT